MKRSSVEPLSLFTPDGPSKTSSFHHQHQHQQPASSSASSSRPSQMRPHLTSSPAPLLGDRKPQKTRPMSHPQAQPSSDPQQLRPSPSHPHHNRVSIKVWVTKARGLPFPSVGNPQVYFRLKIENIHVSPPGSSPTDISTGRMGPGDGGIGSSSSSTSGATRFAAGLAGSVLPVAGLGSPPTFTSVTTQPKEVVFPPQPTAAGVPYGESLVDEWVSLSTFDKEGFITIECWYLGDDAFTKDDFVGVTMIPIATLSPHTLSGWFPFGDSKTEVPFAQCKGETWLEIVSDHDTQPWDRMSKQFHQFVKPYTLQVAISPSPLTGPANSSSGMVTLHLPSVAEKVEMVFDSVMLSTSGLMISRRLYLTSYRLVFVDLASRTSADKETSFSRIHKKLTRPTFVLLASVCAPPSRPFHLCCP